MAEPIYYGIAGHCFDIDGGLWHEPGQCVGAPVNCNGKCCGFETKADEVWPGTNTKEPVDAKR